MFNTGKLRIFHTAVEPLSSGFRIFTKDDKIVDIDELHRALLNGSVFTVICNDVSAHSEYTEKQYFIVTDKLKAEDGYEDTFMFSHFGRSSASITNRKIMMSFSEIGEEPKLKATYFNS